MLAIYAPEKIEGQTLCKLLRRRWFEPKCFQSADQELMESARFGQIAMIILDLSCLPDLDQDMEAILEMAQDVPVIMLTPYATTAHELSSFHQRGYHVMEKPIVLESLVALMHQIAPEL